MTPEDFRQVEDLYHAARELAPDERAALLARADSGLRRAVEALLAEPSDDGPLARPIAQAAAELLNGSNVNGLPVGGSLGPYRIESKLGEGGMGSVYRASDPRLGREVAIKVAHQNFSERFEREARAIAFLNHANVCTLYDIGPNYLVMELVEGATLAERIKRGALPLEEALGIALQIADGLDAAHEKGVVHRDLKPANIKIKPDGTVKVLDFGLAKVAFGRPPESEGGDASHTLSLTEFGTVVGTPNYMSPEQAQGKPVDKRADIWAFGVVVYEMLTGIRPFAATTLAETLSAVLTREPDMSRIQEPARRMLLRCLEKEPKRRLRDIGECRYLLQEPPSAVHKRGFIWPWIGAAGLAVGLGLAVWSVWHSPHREDRSLIRLNADLGTVAVPDANVLEPAISPDGARIVFASRSPEGGRQLAIRSLDGPKVTLLAGTEGATHPFFSPDGQWIGFFSGGKMKKVPVQGGAAVAIADAGANGAATWGDDQSIVYSPGVLTPLLRVSADGGRPVPLTKVGEHGDATHRWPQALPGGRAILFTSHKIITGFDDAVIEAVTVLTGERKTVLRGGYFGRYLPAGNGGGYLLYIHEGALYAVAFDAGSLAVRGKPVAVLDDVAADSDTAAGQFDVSASGTLLYRSGKGPARRWPMLWLDRSGKTEPLLAEPGTYYTPRLSPDGNRLALTVDRGDQGREIEVYDWRRGSRSRLTFTGEVNLFPVWSPDGKYIVFESSSAKGYGLGVVRADGSGSLQRIAENNEGLMIPSSFSKDGRWLAYYEMKPQTGYDIWIAPFDASDADHPKLGKPQSFLSTRYSETNAQFSPNGRWIAYASNESGRNEIYVQPFPGPGPKSQVSTDGTAGSDVAWAPDGGELYYPGRGVRIMVSECREDGGRFIAGKPKVWSETVIGATVFGRLFSLTPDGTRFAIMPPRNAPAESGTVHVVFAINFIEELRRRVR